MIEIVGFLAAILTTTSSLPQAIKVIKTKNTEGISLIMYCLFVAGLSLWFVYGVYTKQVSIWLSNAITVCLASVVLKYKIDEVLKNKK